MEALAASSMDGQWGTRCSMVFLPRRGEVFVAFDREYQRIWKVSLQQKTIETWSGAEEPLKRSIGLLGVTASSLQRGEPTNIPWLVIFSAAGLLLLIVTISGIMVLRSGFRKQSG